MGDNNAVQPLQHLRVKEKACPRSVNNVDSTWEEVVIFVAAGRVDQGLTKCAGPAAWPHASLKSGKSSDSVPLTLHIPGIPTDLTGIVILQNQA